MPLPSHAIIAVTLKCNAKCIMCDIWKRDCGQEVEPPFYQRLPSSLREVNITGGEPFLREDLPEIIEVIYDRCDSPRIVISSNGLLPKRIKDSMNRITRIDDRIAVRISVDAVGKKHDELRGISGAFEKAMESLSILKQNGVRDLGIALTLMDSNVLDVKKVYDLAGKMGVDFSLSVVTSSPIYFGKKDYLKPGDNGALRDGLNYLVRSELRHWSPRKLARAYFDHSLWEYLRTERRPLTCDAGKGFFYLTPNGNLYGCDVLDFPLGNLRDHGFKELWFSGRAEKFRRRAKECNECWMICTAKTAMRRSLHRPFFWLLKNKARAHMRAQIL